MKSTMFKLGLWFNICLQAEFLRPQKQKLNQQPTLVHLHHTAFEMKALKFVLMLVLDFYYATTSMLMCDKPR